MNRLPAHLALCTSLLMSASVHVWANRITAPASSQRPTARRSAGVPVDPMRSLNRYYDLKTAGKEGTASEWIRQAASAHPKALQIQLEAANDRLAQLDQSGALPYLVRAVELAPDNMHTRLQLAYTLNMLGRNEDAIDQFQIASASSNPTIANKAKEALRVLTPPPVEQRVDEPGKATADARQEEKPLDCTASLNRYYELKLTDNPQAASEWILQVAERFPDCRMAQLEAAHNLLAHNEQERALGFLEIAIKLEPTDMRTQLQLGFTLTALGRVEEAKAAFTAVSESSDTENATKARNALNNLSSSVPSESSTSGADPTVLPDDCTAALNMYYGLKSAGQPDEASALIQQIATRFQDNRTAQLEAAYNRLAARDQSGALPYLSRAVALQPADLKTRLQLAYTWNALGRNDKAVEEFRIVSRSDDPELAGPARKALRNLGVPQTGDRFNEIGIDSTYMDRGQNLLTQATAKTGISLTETLSAYIGLRVSRDSRSSEGVNPIIFSDNAITLALGVRYRPYRSPFGLFAEQGLAYRLVKPVSDSRFVNDTRIVAYFSDRLGAPPTQSGLFLDTYADAGFYSRYQNNGIGFLRVRGGQRWLSPAGSIDVYGVAKLTGDTQGVYYNRQITGGLGLVWRPPASSAILRLEWLEGYYYGSGSSAPRGRRTFTDLRAGIECFVQP